MVCQLESSGKWPDEVEAIQQIKAAFYVKMSELLTKDRSLLCSPTFHYLDVLKVACLCVAVTCMDLLPTGGFCV